MVTSDEETQKEPSAKPPREVRVWLPIIEVGHITASSRLSGMPALDGVITGTRGSVLVVPKGVAVDVKRFGLKVRGPGGMDARGIGSVHVRAPGPVWGSFNGHVGDVQLDAFTRVDGEHLNVRAHAPRVRPEEARALWSDWPLHHEASIDVSVLGDLPTLDASATVRAGRAELLAQGPLTLSSDIGAELDAKVDGFDLTALFPDAPETDIDAKVRVSAWKIQDRLVIDVNGTTEPGNVGGEPLPAIDMSGTYDELGFVGRATLHEPGMPTKLDVWVRPGG
jgi:hypothetical protein